MPLPPWLNINPSDFVRAASEGAQAGLGVARLNREADEAAQRSAERGQEFSEAQALRKWEQQQQMQMAAERMRQSMKQHQDQLAALTAYRQSMNEARTQGEKDRAATRGETMRHNLATEGRRTGNAVWHPSDPATGAPGYFESATGTVHIPPKSPPHPDPRIKMMQNELAMHEKAIASGDDQITTGINAGNTHSAFADTLRSNLMDLQRQQGQVDIPPAFNPRPSPSPGTIPPAGQPVAGPSPTPHPSASSTPHTGAVVKGYLFLGGDPSKRESWKKHTEIPALNETPVPDESDEDAND